LVCLAGPDSVPYPQDGRETFGFGEPNRGEGHFCLGYCVLEPATEIETASEVHGTTVPIGTDMQRADRPVVGCWRALGADLAAVTTASCRCIAHIGSYYGYDASLLHERHFAKVAARCDRIVRLLDGRVAEDIDVSGAANPEGALGRLSRPAAG
jgi:hypothetical protein